MKNLSRLIIALVLIGLVGVAAFLGYIWFAGGSGEVSTDISDAAETIEDAGSGTLFRIVSEDSMAIFMLQEDLIGVRTDVIGRTTQVGGDVLIDFENPQASSIGTIRINSRSFVTDQEMRNRALRTNILQSAQDEYEFIDFVPTSIEGLPESITIGETYIFDVIGDLSIVGQTHPVTFSTEVTLDSETQISGIATTTIQYADWGISIPDAPGVANVTDDASLELQFEALAVDDEASTTED